MTLNSDANLLSVRISSIKQLQYFSKFCVFIFLSTKYPQQNGPINEIVAIIIDIEDPSLSPVKVKSSYIKINLAWSYLIKVY